MTMTARRPLKATLALTMALTGFTAVSALSFSASAAPVPVISCILPANADRGIPSDMKIQIVNATPGPFALTINGKNVMQGMTETAVDSLDAVEASAGLLEIDPEKFKTMSAYAKAGSTPEINFFVFKGAGGQVLTAGIEIDGATGGECLIAK